MARPCRIEYEGALYHVLARGNDRRNVFTDDRDRFRFLDITGEMSERFEVEVMAYVLMDNHYHLLLRTRRANLSKSMQWLGATYTRRFNNRHSRCGHLFQGRFKSILVENDTYLYRLSHYIHRNPVRAGMTARLADYRWSSYPNYAYGRRDPDWLATDLILALHLDTPDPHQAYRESARRYADEENLLWEDLRHGFILGGGEFSAKIKQSHRPAAGREELTQHRRLWQDEDPTDILVAAAGALGVDPAAYRKGTRLSGADVFKRDLIVYLLYQLGRWPNNQIGQLFNITYSAVSRRVALMKKKVSEDESVRRQIEQLKSQIKI